MACNESGNDRSVDGSRVALIIPALNESESLAVLLPMLHPLALGQVLVCDNGSTDDTRHIVESHAATWVHEPRRGYGAACYAGMQRLNPAITIVAFMDADLSDDVGRLRDLIAPIQSGECDFLIGTRVRAMQELGATTRLQRFANHLMPALIRFGWGHAYADLGPFRAIRRDALEAMDMQDRAFGWTIEMQVRAVELGLRIREISVPYARRRHGRSKISGTVTGVLRAAYWIIRTCLVLWLTKRRRMKSPTRCDFHAKLDR